MVEFEHMRVVQPDVYLLREILLGRTSRTRGGENTVKLRKALLGHILLRNAVVACMVTLQGLRCGS